MRSDASMDDNDPALLLATRFLGMSLSEFKKWTIKKQIQTRSEKIVTSLNVAQATVVRDSVAKFVYACMFEWLVAIVNESLAGENGDAASKAEMFIGVLDIYGFEHFQKVNVQAFQAVYADLPFRTRLSSSVSITLMRNCSKRCVISKNRLRSPHHSQFNSHVFKLEQE